MNKTYICAGTIVRNRNSQERGVVLYTQADRVLVHYPNRYSAVHRNDVVVVSYKEVK